ncbi:GNAT family N-acetyltransferase [Amycolatopsis sp.]|uniref:GNAT family N-acetyltransferase n=1 Tax=Amycolatopsis sp. TaxID=37632 RepID=UPI002CBA770F|nr:GNAT family N-acetyltransferase [Amycolatopsis sp.]HVV08457.1 GNAT family N-acetyltransferase [Amycolatopsis sp.]
MNDIEIRPAEDRDLTAVAGLRWRWVAEKQVPDTGREEFVRHFTAWAQERKHTHRCLVVARGAEVIGMAFLAAVERVPTPRALCRRSGDVQCVYVVPEERDSGVGGRLLDAVLELGRELGYERVTVHSSDRAIPAYRRHGFGDSPRLLQSVLSS